MHFGMGHRATRLFDLTFETDVAVHLARQAMHFGQSRRRFLTYGL